MSRGDIAWRKKAGLPKSEMPRERLAAWFLDPARLGALELGLVASPHPVTLKHETRLAAGGRASTLEEGNEV